MKHKLNSITIDGVQYNVVKASTEFVCEECHLREMCEDDFADRKIEGIVISNFCLKFTDDNCCFKEETGV